MTDKETKEWLESIKTTSNREVKNLCRFFLMHNLKRSKIRSKAIDFIQKSEHYKNVQSILNEKEQDDERTIGYYNVEGYSLRSYVYNS